MQKWAAGTINNDWNGLGERHRRTPRSRPMVSTRRRSRTASAARCFPGIEAGGFLRDATKFLPVVTVNGVPVVPHRSQRGVGRRSHAAAWRCRGSRTSWPASTYWWPVPRPNRSRWPGRVTSGLDARRGDRDEFVAGKWNKLGFVTRQGGDLVETDRCDSADTVVNLVTPALTFHDVPQGPMGTQRKAARAIVFEINSPRRGDAELHRARRTQASRAPPARRHSTSRATGGAVAIGAAVDRSTPRPTTTTPLPTASRSPAARPGRPGPCRSSPTPCRARPPRRRWCSTSPAR